MKKRVKQCPECGEFGLVHDISCNCCKVRFIDKVAAKGKTKPILIYDIFNGDPSEIRDLKAKTLDKFNSGKN